MFNYIDNSSMISTKVENATTVEKNLKRLTDRLANARNQRDKYLERVTDAKKELDKAQYVWQRAQGQYNNIANQAQSWISLYEQRIESLTKELNVYRLMNDIRTGKILPVVAETGQVADVTFS